METPRHLQVQEVPGHFHFSLPSKSQLDPFPGREAEARDIHLCPALAHLRPPIPGQRASFPGIFQVHTHGSGIDLEQKSCKAPDEGYANWPRLHRPFQRASLASSPRPSSEERAEGTPLTNAQQPKPLVSRSPAPLPTQKPSVATYTHIGDTSRDHPSPQLTVMSHDDRRTPLHSQNNIH